MPCETKPEGHTSFYCDECHTCHECVEEDQERDAVNLNKLEKEIKEYKKFLDKVYKEMYNPESPFHDNINMLMLGLDIRLEVLSKENYNA
jgi:hypothetical protein